MANEIAKTTESKLATAAAKVTTYYINEVANLNEAVGVPLTEEAQRCASNVIIQLCGEIGVSEVQNLPREQLVKVLQFVTINCLDVFNGQVFLDKRKDRSGKYVSINATPMGSAYEVMTARFGVNVKRVHQARIVHEGDEFELPQFDGLNMTNVKHKPTLKGLDGKAIAVYYLIEKEDGTLDFAIATREGVGKNLMAQILNASLRDASANRGELMKRLEGKTLDELLSDEYLAKWISPAYRSPASRESMIITKMKKNALLHYTRDLGVKHTTAFEKVNANIADDTDMVVDTQTGETAQPAAKPTAKIQDFDVDDDGVVEEPKKEVEENYTSEEAERKEITPSPVETEPKVEEPKVEEAPKPEPKKAEKRVELSIFDVDDL